MPFLDLTADMDSDTRKKVANRMVRTATAVALILVVLGAFLMKLLHFSPEALYIAGGIVFLPLALKMLAGAGDEEDHHEKASDRDAMKTALYPLAVPYLLNPAGITLLVIFSGAIDSWLVLGILVVLVLLMGAFDWLIFKNLDSIAQHLDKSRLVMTEAVFGVLLAALEDYIPWKSISRSATARSISGCRYKPGSRSRSRPSSKIRSVSRSATSRVCWVSLR